MQKGGYELNIMGNREDELHERLEILKDELGKGKISLVKGSKVIDSLEKVRYGADGKVDPSTADGLVRALALAVSAIRHKDELKKIPLRDVQLKYFEILETFFGNPYQEMKKSGANPHQIAASVASRDSIVKAFSKDSDAFAKDIAAFWKSFGPVVRAHVEDMTGLKTVYGGDMFPSHEGNILSRTGLYVDTIILPDPMLRIAPLFQVMKTDRVLYYLTKHALSALSLKDIVTAEVDPPIAIIVPDDFSLDEQLREFITSVSEDDTFTHLGKMFGVEFKKQEELDNFLDEIKDVQTLKGKLQSPERLLFDLDWDKLSFEEQWERAQKQVGDIKILSDKGYSVGESVKNTTMGRMMQTNDLIFKADGLRGVPLMDAPTSWQYFLWKYEYDREKSREVNPELKNMLIVNSLQSGELSWLGNVPAEALIKVRQEGVLKGLRETIAKGIGEIENADEESYEEIVGSVIENIDKALEDHRKKLGLSSSQTKKFFGYDIAPWIVNGGLSIVATSLVSIPLGIASAILGNFFIPSPKDIWSEGKKILSEKTEIQRSPVGILLDAKETKK